MSKRDFETISRSIQNGLHGKKIQNSFPFLSGDTFLSLADYVLSGLICNETLQKLQSWNQHNSNVFISTSDIFELIPFLKNTPRLEFRNLNIFIHNGDTIPSVDDFHFLSTIFRKIYSVNWLGDKNLVTPIPIGLENFSFLRNGVPTDFEKLITKGIPKFQDRSIPALSAFSIHTNTIERLKAQEALMGIPNLFTVTKVVTPRQYRKLVLASRFVISPPGNGPDCHRTWEAMYLGAIPIVHKDYWPFNKIKMPVITVDDWKDIPSVVNDFIPREDFYSEEWKLFFYHYLLK